MDMFSDLLTTDGLTPMTKEEYNSAPHKVPYLNAVAFTPSENQMRTQDDDYAVEIDLEPKVMDVAAKDRLHMSPQEFDTVFIRTMNYIRGVETISYQNLQKGAMSIEDMDAMIVDYFHRNCPEVKHENDEQRLLRRLNTALTGYYVLQALIDHPDTTDIKVCAYDDIRVRIKGKAYSSKAHFIDNRDLFMFINGICMRNKVGFNNSAIITFEDNHDRHYLLRFTISSPEVNAVEYPYMHIRKTAKEKPDWDELIKRGMLTENVKNYLINRAKFARCVVFAGPPGCVDKNTEFFNGTEWKFIADYEKGEKVLQFDTNTNEASLVDPIQYIKLPCNKMYHFETKYGINQTLSEEHRVLYVNKTHKNGKKIWSSNIKEMSAAELKEKQNSGHFNGGFLTTFQYSGSGIDLTDDEILLMLAVICDGSFDSRSKYQDRCTVRLKKDRKIEELERILVRLDLPYTKRYESTSKYTTFRFIPPRREKIFSSDWYNCTDVQFQLICENILQWDGSISNNRRTFSTTVKENADFVQFAFSVCGYRVTVTLSHRAGDKYLTNGRVYTRKNEEYTLCISENTIVGMSWHNDGRENNAILEEVVPEDGYKYCFTVPTHALVLRRNNNIFITGNSGKSTGLNAFIEFIPKTRESLVIQENDELFTNQPGFMFKHVTHGFDGGRIYTLEDLARMALVEGCNEFIVGEVKGGEMRNVMTLINSGGYGALTVHSNNAYEVLDKLADLVKYGSNYSFEEARRMLRSVDTIVYMEGYKVRQILECHGYNDETKQFIYENIYEYNYEEHHKDELDEKHEE